MTTNWPARYASRITGMVPSDIRELAKAMRQPDVISFGGGIPEPTLFPHDVVADSFQRILTDAKTARIALQYSESGGYMPLREWLAGYMGSMGAPCGPENILVTSGSQQGLDFVGRLLLSPGDTVLVETPTYIGALRAFDACEAKYGALPSPENPNPPAAKFGYLMPDFQNPQGTSLSLAEREDLLDRAEALDLPLLEDSAYEKLRFEGTPIPPLIALAIKRAGGIEKSRVLYTGTFSKTIVPSLRVGWLVAPSEVIAKLILIKQAADLHTSTLNQMVMMDLAQRMLNEQHLNHIRATYKRRRDVTLAALATHMPPGVSWTKPEGGLYIWVTLPPGVDGTAFATKALAENRVAVVSGKSCFAVNTVPNTIRLSFSLIPEDKAEEGVKRLAELLRRI
jgi:DNA-binding transcriptional MocR family regulator